MTVASALLQPQRFARVSVDANLRLMEDVGRLIAVIFEDLANEGPLAQAVVDAAVAMGPRLQHELEARFRTVASALRIRAQAFVTSLEGLGDEFAAASDDPAKALALGTRLLQIVTDALANLTYPKLREGVQFFVDLLENDLGLSAAFIEGQILAFLNDAADRIAALDDGGDAEVRRQRRGCVSTLRRLARFFQSNFHFPGLDVHAVARALPNPLPEGGIDEVVRQVRCALDEFEAAVGSAQAFGEALPGRLANPPSVGAAGVINLPKLSTYAWYPSWLLGDEDLPLIGLSDVKNAAHLIVTIRDSSLEVPKWLREKFSASELQLFFDVTTGTEPTEDQKLVALAVLNKLIQGPLIYDSEHFPSLSLPDDLREQQLKAIDDNHVLLANRRFISHIFRDDLGDASDHSIRNGIFRYFLDLIELPQNQAWPRNQVSVSADGRFIMCGDMPLLTGENLKWQDAPIFSTT